MIALGIDHGDARIGVAASDSAGIMAHPVETIETRSGDPISRIVELVAERQATSVVVGMPFRLDGSRGTAAEKVQGFIKRLTKALPDEITIIAHDERLSTVSAQAKLHEAGRNVKNSRAIIDQAAAVEILQDWLDAN